MAVGEKLELGPGPQAHLPAGSCEALGGSRGSAGPSAPLWLPWERGGLGWVEPPPGAGSPWGAVGTSGAVCGRGALWGLGVVSVKGGKKTNDNSAEKS